MASSPSFSSPQQIALAVAPVVTGVLSFLGSLCIIYIIVKEREKKLQKTYHRLLLAMSAADIVGSVRACCSSFAMPVGSWWMAHGNTATCEFQGFAAQLSISAALYSACLGIYFFITIKNVDKSKIARCIEPVMHGLAILFPVTTAIAGMVLNLFNPVELGVGCWVSAYPTGCADTLDIECTRGQNAGILVLLFGGIPVALSLVIVIVSMLSIFVTVRSTIRKMERRYSVVAQQNHNRSSEHRIRQTAVQAGLYIGAFILTYLWTCILRLLENDGKSQSYFVVSLLAAIFYPLQGSMNFFIYIRPRFVGLRRTYPKERCIDTMARIFHLSEPRKSSSTATLDMPTSASLQVRDVSCRQNFNHSSPSTQSVVAPASETNESEEKHINGATDPDATSEYSRHTEGFEDELTVNRSSTALPDASEQCDSLETSPV